MPRIRSLKPECLQHRKVGRLSDRAFRLWVAMILHADDEGRLVADPEQLRLQTFGYQDKTTAKNVDTALDEIASHALIRRYTVHGTAYADFPSWTDHQAVRKSGWFKASKIPDIEQADHSQTTGGVPTENPPLNREVMGDNLRNVQTASSQPVPTDNPARDNGLDPELTRLLSECPFLTLVASADSAAFWDRVLGTCEDAKVKHSWLAGKVRQWDQWFASHPDRKSRNRKKLEARLMGWLTRDLERLARTGA